jgi:ABC-type transporter Mla subunit MlaD
MSQLDGILDAARRGLTTSVGLGVLVFQNAQVQRRELSKAAPQALQELGDAVGDRLKSIGEKLADLDERADDIFDDIEQRLPEQLRAPVRQVHTAMRDLRAQASTAVRQDGADD